MILAAEDVSTFPRDGDEVKICVDEVGTGVGYFACSSYVSLVLFNGRGRAGDEKGSKAGSNDDGGFFVATTEGDASGRVSTGAGMSPWSKGDDQRLVTKTAIVSRASRLP